MKTKIKLDDEIRSFLLEERKKTGKPAEIVSENIGKSKSWLAQIENGRLKNITQESLIALFSYLLSKPEDEAELYIKNAIGDYIENRNDEEIEDEVGNNYIADLLKKIDKLKNDYNYISDSILDDDIKDTAKDQLKLKLNEYKQEINDWLDDLL